MTFSNNNTSEGLTSMTFELDPTSIEETRHEPAPILSICTDGSRCGSAIYLDACVHLIADRRDTSDPYKGLDIIIQRTDPKVVIVSAVQKRLITFLEKRFKLNILDLSRKDGQRHSSNAPIAIGGQFVENSFSNEEELPENCTLGVDVIEDALDFAFTLTIVPNCWFSVSKGLQKLYESEFVTNHGFTDQEEKTLFITSKFKTSADVCAIRSISAINNYLEHVFTNCDKDITGATQNLQTHQANVSQTHSNRSQMIQNPVQVFNLMPILGVDYIEPGPVLSIDKCTFESLGIFKHTTGNVEIDIADDRTPCLFELLNQCYSPQGRRYMRTFMMWPLQDTSELMLRHDTVEFLISAENRLLCEQLGAQLKSVVPLAGLMTKLSHSVGSISELAKLYKALWSFIAIIDLIKANEGHNLEIFNRITALESPTFREAVDSIMNVVDFEASKRDKRVQICLGVDENIDQKKEIINNLMTFCDEVAVQETAKYKESLGEEFRVFYLPRIGFLSSIYYSTTTELLQMRNNKEFDILLHTEQSVYFKTKRMVELDNNAGDIACDLIDHQEKVLLELQNRLLKHSETILKLVELCSELDCLMSFANVSFQRGYTKPEFASIDEELEIRGSYHPIHCTRLNIVPNDVQFYKSGSSRNAKVMVITGPNSSGKTTYMKATCLVLYMAHIGCFVPATYARLPIVDAILTRIHSANSISTGLSSFATDLHQINYALSKATSKSFIAIDEFGKGTRARDGFHLLKGLVTYFASRARGSPYVMVVTHYNRLANHLTSYSEYILYKTFKVKRDSANDTVVYEYKLVDGIGEISLADRVAQAAGVPQCIIERANQIRNYITGQGTLRPKPPSGA